jgi:hypothetical protein
MMNIARVLYLGVKVSEDPSPIITPEAVDVVPVGFAAVAVVVFPEKTGLLRIEIVMIWCTGPSRSQ